MKQLSAGNVFIFGQEISAMHHLAMDISIDCVDGDTTFKRVVDNIPVLYPFIGGSHSTCRVNFVNAGTYNFNTPGAVPVFNRINGCVCTAGLFHYIDTTYQLTGAGDVATFSGMGIHRRDSNNDTDATYGVASSGNSYGLVRSDVNRQTFISSNRSDASTGSLSVNAWWSSGHSTATVLNAYRNGAVLKSQTVSLGNMGNQTIYIGAYHNSLGPVWGASQPPQQIDFFWIRKNYLTDRQELSLYSAGSKFVARVFR